MSASSGATDAARAVCVVAGVAPQGGLVLVAVRR